MECVFNNITYPRDVDHGESWVATHKAALIAIALFALIAVHFLVYLWACARFGFDEDACLPGGWPPLCLLLGCASTVCIMIGLFGDWSSMTVLHTWPHHQFAVRQITVTPFPCCVFVCSPSGGQGKGLPSCQSMTVNGVCNGGNNDQVCTNICGFCERVALGLTHGASSGHGKETCTSFTENTAMGQNSTRCIGDTLWAYQNPANVTDLRLNESPNSDTTFMLWMGVGWGFPVFICLIDLLFLFTRFCSSKMIAAHRVVSAAVKTKLAIAKLATADVSVV